MDVRRARLHSSDGQTSAEYIGVIVLVAAIIVALVAFQAQLGGAVAGGWRTAVCAMTGSGCGSPDGGGTDVAAGSATAAQDAPAAAEEADAADDEDTGNEEDSGGGIGGWLGDRADNLGDAAGWVGDRAGDVGGAVATGASTAWDGGSALLNGFVLGDAGDGYDSGWRNALRNVGHIASGVLIFGDVRDGAVAGERIVSSGGSEGWGDLGWSVAGLVPVLGDIGKGARGVARTADAADTGRDTARAADDLAGAGRQGDDLPHCGRSCSQAELDELRARRGTTNSQDARILAENRAAAGAVKPKGYDSHHIVPPRSNLGEAGETRAHLERLDIPLNHEANGIELPSSRLNPDTGRPYYDGTGATPHQWTHTNHYYERLNERLAQAETREEGLEILEQIGEELATHQFPYRDVMPPPP